MSTQSDLRRDRRSEGHVRPAGDAQQPYLQMTLPLDVMLQGLICSEHATAFHVSGRHRRMSRTGTFMDGILMVPLDHSLKSLMAPWSDCMLQLRNSSVGLWGGDGGVLRLGHMTGPRWGCL